MKFNVSLNIFNRFERGINPIQGGVWNQPNWGGGDLEGPPSISAPMRDIDFKFKTGAPLSISNYHAKLCVCTAAPWRLLAAL